MVVGGEEVSGGGGGVGGVEVVLKRPVGHVSGDFVLEVIVKFVNWQYAVSERRSLGRQRKTTSSDHHFQRACKDIHFLHSEKQSTLR